MATAREIRRRMSSIGNIRQITRAMELIAVTRLRRAQQRVLASRPYADKMREVLGDLVRRVDVPTDQIEEGEAAAGSLHPLLDRRPVTRVGVVVLSTDRGLCGALNSNILRTALQHVYEHQNAGHTVEIVGVGRKGLQILRRQPVTLVAEFTALGDYPDLTRVAPIARLVMDAFTGHQLDEVSLVYPRFISTLRLEPTVLPLLPIRPPESEEAVEETHGPEVDYIYEPSPREVLAALLPRFVEMQVYQAVLELIASEFSSRMVAMRNASDNANELLGDLRLGYNKARQATITREIIEVAAGASAGR